MPRVDEIDIPGLHELAAEHDWIEFGGVIGRGLQRMIAGMLYVRAYAWRAGQTAPELRSGPWEVHISLIRGMAVQPIVLVAPDDAGFLPAGGNITDWLPHHGPGDRPFVPPGAVCYAEHWHPRLTLAWLVHQVAQIVVGQALNFESEPLSLPGRDFQAAALAAGKLPTQVISTPRLELLDLDPRHSEVSPNRCEIEFHDAPT